MRFRASHGVFAMPLALCPMLYSSTVLAQSKPLVDVCSGLSVNLPVLQPVASGLNALLQPLANIVNVDLVGALSGKNIGVSVLDTNGQAVSAPGNCGLSTDQVAIDTNAGISMGGGVLAGLGGSGNAQASAGEAHSIALGNGATTTTAAANSIALGLRGSVTATDGVALGRDTAASVAGGVAIGSGSVADRAGMDGAREAFSGTRVTSTAGALSVGSAGGERQITNVAGGTQDTDAVNLRQLRTVNSRLNTRIDDLSEDVATEITNLTNNMTTVANTLTTRIDSISTDVDVLQQDVVSINAKVNGLSGGMEGAAASLGGGASYNSTTNVFTGPSYTLRGNTYTDVGTALAALNGAIGGAGTNGAVSGNNTSGLADASATGADATAVGYGSKAAHEGSTAVGTGAATTRNNQVMIGTSSNTYTMPGISSAASRAAQTGATRVLTTDAAGNIATSDVDLNRMSADISELRGATSELRKESRQGIAAAMAMTAAPTPSAPGKTAWATNVSSFKGEMATSFAVAHTFDTSYPVTFNASLGYAPGGSAGVRMGLSGEF